MKDIYVDVPDESFNLEVLNLLNELDSGLAINIDEYRRIPESVKTAKSLMLHGQADKLPFKVLSDEETVFIPYGSFEDMINFVDDAFTTFPEKITKSVDIVVPLISHGAKTLSGRELEIVSRDDYAAGMGFITLVDHRRIDSAIALMDMELGKINSRTGHYAFTYTIAYTLNKLKSFKPIFLIMSYEELTSFDLILSRDKRIIGRVTSSKHEYQQLRDNINKLREFINAIR